MLNSYDDHHCLMLSLHGDELRCGVYLSTKKQCPFTVVSEQNDNEKPLFHVRGVPTIYILFHMVVQGYFTTSKGAERIVSFPELIELEGFLSLFLLKRHFIVYIYMYNHLMCMVSNVGYLKGVGDLLSPYRLNSAGWLTMLDFT